MTDDMKPVITDSQECCGNCTFRRYTLPGPEERASAKNVYCHLLPNIPFTFVSGADPSTREPLTHTIMIRRLQAIDDSCGFFSAGEPGEKTAWSILFGLLQP